MTLACITLILPAACTFSLLSEMDLKLMTDHASELDNAKDLMKLLEDGAPDPADASLRGLLILSRGTSIILFSVYLAYLFFQLRTHSTLFEAEGEDEEEVADMDQWSAGGWLVIITVITAFCADILVGSIDETATQWHIPKRSVPSFMIVRPLTARFIGLILLPLVGNAAEHVTSVWMACKG